MMVMRVMRVNMVKAVFEGIFAGQAESRACVGGSEQEMLRSHPPCDKYSPLTLIHKIFPLALRVPPASPPSKTSSRRLTSTPVF